MLVGVWGCGFFFLGSCYFTRASTLGLGSSRGDAGGVYGVPGGRCSFWLFGLVFEFFLKFIPVLVCLYGLGVTVLGVVVRIGVRSTILRRTTRTNVSRFIGTFISTVHRTVNNRLATRAVTRLGDSRVALLT